MRSLDNAESLTHAQVTGAASVVTLIVESGPPSLVSSASSDCEGVPADPVSSDVDSSEDEMQWARMWTALSKHAKL